MADRSDEGADERLGPEPAVDADDHADGATDLGDVGDRGATDDLDVADALEGFQSPLSRFVSRAKGWMAALVALAMIVSAGGWALNEYAFGAAGDAVEQELGDDAALTEAMLLVRTTDCSGRSSSGSAFGLDLDGQAVVVTNRHVVDGARTIGVRPLAGGPALPVEAHRLADSADVAVLELADPDDLPPLLRAGADPSVGDEVRIVGFPAARPSTSAGPVDDVSGGRLLLDLVVDPGASGSPVLDDAGLVVGQVFAQADDGRGVATSLTALVQAARTATPAPAC